MLISAAMHHAQVGKPVCNFTFTTYNRTIDRFEDVSIQKVLLQNQWLVFVFYQSDFSIQCAELLTTVAAKQETLLALGVTLISVSTDTQYAHLAWCRAEPLLAHIKFPMAADPYGTLARYFGYYNEQDMTSTPGICRISPQGILVESEHFICPAALAVQ